MPERTGLSVESTGEGAASSCLRGARIWHLPVLSGRPRSALMRRKGSDSRKGLHPAKGPRRVLVRDGKRRDNPGDVGSIPPVFPVRSQALEQGFFPPSINDHFRYLET
jgi:hypothetical protein